MVLIMDVVCEFCIETVYCICVFCWELKGAEKSVLGGTMNFRRPAKIHGQAPIFVGLGLADENSSGPAIFVGTWKPTKIKRPIGHRGRRKYPAGAPIFVGLGEADENK
jgi:hypothetical protein